jgi:hypothetical protein
LVAFKIGHSLGRTSYGDWLTALPVSENKGHHATRLEKTRSARKCQPACRRRCGVATGEIKVMDDGKNAAAAAVALGA